MTALAGSGALRNSVGLHGAGLVLLLIAELELRRDLPDGDPVVDWLGDLNTALPDLPALLSDGPGSGDDDGRAVTLTLASESESLSRRAAAFLAALSALSRAFLAASSRDDVAKHFGTL
jgi:hypothetical protein